VNPFQPSLGRTAVERLIHLLILALACAPALADSFAGKVVRVVDGDTLDVLADGPVVHRVRLAGIDAPESGQPFGARARLRLLAFADGERVEVDWSKRDKYGRIVGKLICNGRDLNLAMVRTGFAWWFREYAGEQSAVDQLLYETAEDRARAERLGLWAEPETVALWGWRHRRQPPASYAVGCPCGSGRLCTGKRGGRFCVSRSGTRRYRVSERW
jgi:endonuclease YncB( thermonuclease family)